MYQLLHGNDLLTSFKVVELSTNHVITRKRLSLVENYEMNNGWRLQFQFKTEGGGQCCLSKFTQWLKS